MSDLTHLDPTGRFTGLADLYTRYRPGYPDEVVDFMLAQGGLRPGDTVADIGCGTGISSRLLAARGLFIIGIEPNADMRSAAALAPLSPRGRGAGGEGATPVEAPSPLTPGSPPGGERRMPEYRDGQAEHTGLADRSCRAVLSAQAFHWFKPDEALREFHRILMANGWLFLLWNERDHDDSFTAAYGEIVRRWPKASEVEAKRSGEILLSHPLYRYAQLKQFTNQQVLDADGLVGRTFSVSYAPRDPQAAETLRRELLELFRGHQINGQVTLRYRTLLYFAQA